jgi:hypothetical protein
MIACWKEMEGKSVEDILAEVLGGGGMEGAEAAS